MISRWISRCLPGFSVIILLALLLLTADFVPLPWKRPLSPSDPEDLTLAQRVFMVYSIFVHTNMFAFTVRLAWALLRIPVETKRAIDRRVSRAPDLSPSESGYQGTSSQKLPDSSVFEIDNISIEEDEVVHAIILPNYSEDIDTLRTTLNVLASHPRARAQYEIYLAMEQKETGSSEKATSLLTAYETCFLDIRATFHPSNIPGEIAGKSSNVSFAARYVADVHRSELYSTECNIIITVMDADTHLWQDYFTEIRRLHFTYPTDAFNTLYTCPIIFDRNSNDTPILVRCADLLWSFAGLSTMHPASPISIPTSVYSLSLPLADRVGGWDTDPTAIGEDMHMMLKCYFETCGTVVSRVVHIPASQCNISSDASSRSKSLRTLSTCTARYRQALRHMWGALDSGFAARNSTSLASLKLLSKPRHLALLHLLFEAHFLPCHIFLLLIFSAAYPHLHPSPTSLPPAILSTLNITSILRTLSFLGMNICLSLFERWYGLCLAQRRGDMLAAGLGGEEVGFSERRAWSLAQVAERVCFPVAGTLFGAVPTFHAVFAHFATERLVYRVSGKPVFGAVVNAGGFGGGRV
ncbi:hypothetical protein P170DRAFT_453600 [Aspergillus steynii IBT 23096]|uniref:Glycosyltransferase 2-like domain-containing protein n=1 Tax=Aspergillus steynii IBT 23096 TaxID=1392250 RepID=A0A2I2GGS3_9EURO|nr:uncharacterized protein P170DRAFT_453600 [Aspergillus steynii IBT 23096]PLB52074.1 hypothetical protein P170DRAFT_453600 [Aspergillus steynii IBT 23096]